MRAAENRGRFNQWLGDVDQLRLTIAHADRKTAQLHQGLTEPPVLVTARPIATTEGDSTWP